MNRPHIAQTEPYKVTVKAGRQYWWCACGLSKRQPFCDGSHKVTKFEPLEFTAGSDGDIWFCGCKQTNKSPLCDGSHNKLAANDGMAGSDS